ncbi:TIGR02147 family protein [Bdellovibrio sp. HCB290]|uniref:TIGR02147 family protein n=1 Tax=Bdellovibrio sp. HCB290 TaxID=3394356 RepID=UPI0039B52639
MAVSKNAPVVYDYLDITFYLQDYYKFRKSTEKSFSYESWSQELQINSRSFLRLVVIGKKRVSDHFVEEFSRLNFATKNEEEYFAYLVKYSRASTQKDKQAFGAELLRILKTNTQQTTVPEFTDFISSPMLPRLLTLLSFKDLPLTAQTFTTLLKLPEGEVVSALNKLEEMKLVCKEDKDGKIHWQSLNSKFKVQDKKGSVDLMKFHRQSLLEAIEAFHLPLDLRRYKSLLLPFSEQELKLFYEAMDTFASEQFVRFSGDEYEGRRLFQINLNVHPVAELCQPLVK